MPASAPQAAREDSDRVIVLGDAAQSGVYLLRIAVHEALAVAFGRFRQGQVIDVPPGEYVYVGSAMAARGAVSLARRLVRHATRSGDRNPHPIRAEMIEIFGQIGLGEGSLLPRRAKKLFWNIDYLLDADAVELKGVIAVRSHAPLEAQLGQLLEDDPRTFVLERGLGAHDTPGSTHILGVQGGDRWWADLLERVRGLAAL
jgi:Uri superfamily endonuclease